MQGLLLCSHKLFTDYLIVALQVSRYRKQARQPPDLKLIFVPLIFLLLRVWSSILNVPAYYYSPPKYPFGTEATYALVFISVGIFCTFTFTLPQNFVHS